MATPDTEQLLALLCQSVERLSEPAESQVAWLRTQSLTDADELALEFDDIYPAVAQLHGTPLSDRSLRLLARLNTVLDELSEDPERWQLDALTEDFAWREVRQLAGDILAEVRHAA